ncbi:hypothetical protein SEA_KARDASHIAN_39 [Streptomyces phage Kardashian]|nr:hypothetical protein SEA_KARDASHIAN_39 [Streptomyces phage Kardashian]
MSQIPTIDQLKQMSDEERAALTRKMNRRAVRNILIFAGVKAAIFYGLHRWAKSMAENN